jgi:hypothetical protein
LADSTSAGDTKTFEPNYFSMEGNEMPPSLCAANRPMITELPHKRKLPLPAGEFSIEILKSSNRHSCPRQHADVSPYSYLRICSADLGDRKHEDAVLYVYDIRINTFPPLVRSISTSSKIFQYVTFAQPSIELATSPIYRYCFSFRCGCGRRDFQLPGFETAGKSRGFKKLNTDIRDGTSC